MKIWIKYLIGCVLGIVATFVFPADALSNSEILAIVADLAIRCGRYILPALLFFSVSVAVCQLIETKKMLKTVILTLLIAVSTSVVFSLLGLGSVLLFKIPRIPILVDIVTQDVTLGIEDNIKKLFPYSSFEVLLDGVFYLPVMLFALFAGAGCAADKNASKQAVGLFDSLSRVCFNILSIIVEIFSVGFIAVSCRWCLTFRSILVSGIYNKMILVFLADFAFIAFIFYPLMIKIFCREVHPYKVLYASISSILCAFITGDANITLAISLKTSKDYLGIRRRSGTITFPLLTMLARGGSAMAIIISFVTILKSYSNLGISASDIFWITSSSCLISFCLGALPSGGMYVALTILCLEYGRGFEAGYLLLKPVVPVICSFAAAIDAATMMFGSYIAASKLKLVEIKDAPKYIK